jgi:hypothetical protein
VHGSYPRQNAGKAEDSARWGGGSVQILQSVTPLVPANPAICADAPMGRCADGPMGRWADAPMRRCADAQMKRSIDQSIADGSRNRRRVIDQSMSAESMSR